MTLSARQRFLSYVRDPAGVPHIVSPFLPHHEVVRSTLASLHLPVHLHRNLGGFLSGQFRAVAFGELID